MKTRQGFVSNSSTSSFVIVGFTSTDDKYDYENAIWLDAEDCWLVGETLAEGDECNFGGDSPIAIGNLVQISHAIAKEHGVPLSEIELHFGMRQC